MMNAETIHPAGAAVSPSISYDSPAQAEKSERRREGARKAAATVRARREQEKRAAAVAQLVEESLDRVTAQVMAANAEDDRHALDPPGTPRAKELVAAARARGLEFDLFIHAHRIRAPWHATDWPAEVRKQLGEWLASKTTPTETTPRTKKGPRK